VVECGGATVDDGEVHVKEESILLVVMEMKRIEWNGKEVSKREKC